MMLMNWVLRIENRTEFLMIEFSILRGNWGKVRVWGWRMAILVLTLDRKIILSFPVGPTLEIEGLLAQVNWIFTLEPECSRSFSQKPIEMYIDRVSFTGRSKTLCKPNVVIQSVDIKSTDKSNVHPKQSCCLHVLQCIYRTNQYVNCNMFVDIPLHSCLCVCACVCVHSLNMPQ